jgi:hypothetical protein
MKNILIYLAILCFVISGILNFTSILKDEIDMFRWFIVTYGTLGLGFILVLWHVELKIKKII